LKREAPASRFKEDEMSEVVSEFSIAVEQVQDYECVGSA
jgi:hypothetical protein